MGPEPFLNSSRSSEMYPAMRSTDAVRRADGWRRPGVRRAVLRTRRGSRACRRREGSEETFGLRSGSLNVQHLNIAPRFRSSKKRAEPTGQKTLNYWGVMTHPACGLRSRYNAPVATGDYTIRDLGGERVLTIKGAEYRTYYSERVVRMLIERKGLHRAPLYFPFKETRGRHFLARLFAYLAARGAWCLRVLEAGCSFGHITEYLNEQPLVAEIHAYDVDRPFVDMTRAKVEELGLGKVRQVLHLTDEETPRLPLSDAGFDLVLAV